LLFLGAAHFHASLQMFHGPAVEHLEQRILKTIPQLGAGPLGIGERVQRQHHQVLGGLNLRGETPNDTRIVNVAALRDLDHGEVMLNDEAKRVGCGAVEPQAFCDGG